MKASYYFHVWCLVLAGFQLGLLLRTDVHPFTFWLAAIGAPFLIVVTIVNLHLDIRKDKRGVYHG